MKKETLIKDIDKSELEFYDAPRIIWVLVKEAIKLLWIENPKLHDLGGLAESIKEHGFQELPKLDSNLISISNKKGAIKAGNGRIETLAWMEHDKKYDLPRGLAKVKETGAWVMPLLVGTDAESIDLARSYAIDSNNLTMTGGDFTALDISRLWDQGKYLNVLKKLQVTENMPVSVDGDDLDLLAKILDFSPFEDDDYADVEDEHRLTRVSVHIGNPEAYEDVLSALHGLRVDNPGWELEFVS